MFIRLLLFPLQDVLAETGKHGGRFCAGRSAFRGNPVTVTSVNDSMSCCPGYAFVCPSADCGLIDEFGEITIGSDIHISVGSVTSQHRRQFLSGHGIAGAEASVIIGGIFNEGFCIILGNIHHTLCLICFTKAVKNAASTEKKVATAGDKIAAAIEANKPVEEPEHEEEVGIDVFARLEMRACKIIACEPVPKAKKLLKLQLDLGYEQRQVVSGIAKFYAPDQLIGKKVVLVRLETSPEDITGMKAAQGILTVRGGMTSHAAVVARGMGKCCVSGAGELEIDYKARTIKIGDLTIKEGDWISLNGSTGEVYLGQVATKEATLDGDFGMLMELASKYSVLKVRANADTPRDAEQAFAFGAEGIGLCRTEHMFFEGDRIKAIREMILADDEAGRRVALAKLLPMQRGDFEGLFKVMKGYPVIVRLLDPPLHEFVPHTEKDQKELADEMGISFEKVAAKVESLHEVNPMLGHRGCRLGNTYPEITEMQARAIIEAAMNVKASGIPVKVEIMVPLVGNHKELRYQKNIIDRVANEVFAERNDKIDYMVGTMIEVPRAAVTANQIAEVAEFFSFGTNDLTQMTLGFSRDDIAKFLPIYLEKNILKNDPFKILDRNGVGQLVREAVFKGRTTRPDLKCGICGEHGGEPSSVEFCHHAGLNYVSCSPFRVPIARLAAAHAALSVK